jgi:MarR family transcriptional regulator for hemolysin
MATSRKESERQLTSDIVRLSRVYRKNISRVLTAFGISDSQSFPVLHIARSGGGMRQNMLAEELGLQGPSLVRLLNQLSTSGLVERHDDIHDKRAKNLHLTEAGNTLAKQVENRLEQLRKRLLQSVSDDDLAATLRVFAILEKEIESMQLPAKDKAE